MGHEQDLRNIKTAWYTVSTAENRTVTDAQSKLVLTWHLVNTFSVKKCPLLKWSECSAGRKLI